MESSRNSKNFIVLTEKMTYNYNCSFRILSKTKFCIGPQQSPLSNILLYQIIMFIQYIQTCEEEISNNQRKIPYSFIVFFHRNVIFFCLNQDSLTDRFHFQSMYCIFVRILKLLSSFFCLFLPLFYVKLGLSILASICNCCPLNHC